MDLINVVQLLVPIAFAIMVYVLSYLNRQIVDLEVRMRASVSVNDVRLLISDKIDPLKEDISEIKQKLDTLLSYQLNTQLKNRDI